MKNFTAGSWGRVTDPRSVTPTLVVGNGVEGGVADPLGSAIPMGAEERMKKPRIKQLSSLTALPAFLVLTACGPAAVVPEANWTSVRDDVFVPTCSCHQSDSPSGGLFLGGDSAASLIDVDASSNFVDWKDIVPGMPQESLVYVRLSGGAEGVAPMPPLSTGIEHADVVDAIGAWIEAGAED
jgi:hypothetical protein